MGGILGIGAKQVMAPLDQLSLEGDRLIWKTSQTKDDLKQSADYEKDNHREVSSNDYQTVGELKQSIGQ
ncbi:hypothetical protein [Marinobacter sp. ATCH36]|uniref:hypothetical protein n=1 Tax=Marinobacter sp. ATCH36 TaxID=2945106 RepID=UPI0020222009|nr:hypothetical protein [Marinobacter sp. ATCH36]MCL7944698.1 hypothetical protein [Marinobacter sp. ATCH36]